MCTCVGNACVRVKWAETWIKPKRQLGQNVSGVLKWAKTSIRSKSFWCTKMSRNVSIIVKWAETWIKSKRPLGRKVSGVLKWAETALLQ